MTPYISAINLKIYKRYLGPTADKSETMFLLKCSGVNGAV